VSGTTDTLLHVAPAPSANSAVLPDSSFEPKNLLRVLLIEDNGNEAILITHLLRSGMGSVPVYTASVRFAAAALEELQRSSYDLLLLDYHLGSENGLDLLREIRRRGWDVPAVFLTGQGDESTVMRAMKSGACDYLSKANLTEGSLAQAVRYAVHLHRQELLLAMSERQYRKLSRAVEQSADTVVITDVQGNIEFVNPAFESLTGYSREEVIGKNPRLLKSNIQDPRFYRELWETILAGKVFRGVLINRKKNGELFYAEKTITPVRDPDGAVTHFISNDRDITDRRRAEQALRSSEERYRTLFERNMAGVFRSTLYGELLECNPALARMFGYEREEMLHIKTSGLYQDESQRQSLMERLLREKSVGNVELRGKRKDGGVVWLLCSMTVVSDEKGSAELLEGTVLDITEYRKLEERLLQVQKMDAIGQLAGGVAHDFNNLLMVISSYAELMLDKLSDDDPLYRQAAQILNASRCAAALTSQLLAFSRKQEQSPQVLDLNAVLQEIDPILARLIGEDVRLSISTEPSLWRIMADPVQIEQVILNLAANARDALPGGGTLSIATCNLELLSGMLNSEVPTGKYVLLTVKDSGAGIDPAVLPRIFDPFFTTKELGKGTGLGLSTVYGIVKQSGGHITVSSAIGKGTIFSIYLPPSAASEGQFEPRELVVDPANGSETLLLVEDEDAVRESARQFLEQHGYKVIAARSGREALALAQGYWGEIHLMITDVVMPEMSGTELAEHMSHARPTTGVLFISGYPEKIVYRHGVEDLHTCFLQKPFTLKALGHRLREILQVRPSAATSLNRPTT
jgi:two-component system cell cycle sensor histidine kinase/response regulator CckA